VAANFGTLPGGLDMALAADFCIEPQEIEKGQAAAANFLDSTKSAEERSASEEALETLALLLSSGECKGTDFPWHQVRAHHAQAAFTTLKEEGAPGRLEILRCRVDPNRKYKQVADNFTAKNVKSLRLSIRRVLKECTALGFLSEDDFARTISPKTARRSDSKRIVTYGEFRALLAICDLDSNVGGLRDGLIFYFLYHGGLRLSELTSIVVDDLGFDQETGLVTVNTGKAKNQKQRQVPLPNEALIALEDWLEVRGSHQGPLLNVIKKNQRVEQKRLTGPDIKAICEKRAQQAGVALFSADEMRKSTEEQIRLYQSQMKSSSEDLTDSLDGQSIDGNGSLARPGMAKICFPYWEQMAGD
jgi:integrase/recombinase XerD